jgi:N-acyl-D-amino-acid deacylase
MSMSLCDAGYATALLDIWVRQREVLTLGQAVHKLTVAPAALFGIPNRGMLAEGSMADLVLFDPQAAGIVATFVVGTQVYAQGMYTRVFPGRVLHSDT